MRRALLSVGTLMLMLSSPATIRAQKVVLFDSDPFAGTNALTTPGRQIIGNELFTTFDVLGDVFAFNRDVFGMGDVIRFATGPIGTIPTSDINAVVLQTFDNDANPNTGFGAGNAATLLAGQITSSGAGVFVYFNSGLDLARLVYSTDLSDPTADLKILARLTNFQGQAGRDLMPAFTESNFVVVTPEPSTALLLFAGVAVLVGGRAIRRR